MSITDELRTGGIYRFQSNRRVFTEEELTAIADRIDAEYERACAEAYGNGVMSVPIALDESAWVELPKDAGGVPIHVGDVMEWRYDNGEFEVIGIGGNTLFYIDKDSGECEWTAAGDKRHHHVPTVEDVLTEFGIDWEHESDCEDRAALLREYAAKLRLAEGSE